ncbi:uncharacterized protein Dwil_GK27989 [Drosophila willistoni]|uniref:Uncharacterized protein n=1 Tax=Drosophila willistoni TaxID=7260 RepID=A0A0Q9WNS5_DROWI|nr:uncharacterized protein Dwil_GK27989 [Drosophila willistoni]
MAKLLNEVFCMSLHTAGFVIGVLGCIGSVLMMFIIGVALFGADELARSFAKDEMDKFEPVDESMQQREEHYHTILNIYIFRGIFSLYKHIQEIQKQEQPLNLQIDNEAAHPTDTYPIYSKL